MENHAKNGKIITKYKQYLKLEKSFSSNTIDAYLTDLDKLMAYLTLEGKDCLEVTLDDLETFSAGLHDIGINARSQARILSGVRAFYRFLLLEDYIQQDPCELLESPQTGRHLPDVLTVEEIDRLKAHIKAARQLLATNEAVGRRLDFLCQELNREANTTCSKAADIAITDFGMELKALIEQFREQVQNIE